MEAYARDVGDQGDQGGARSEERQFVGIDLHRRRSVIVRMDAAGDVLEVAKIVNDVHQLSEVIARAGRVPAVVLEATYGWYWAVDALQAAGAEVHLAHPLGVKAFEYRRVKNDVRDASDLADLLRLGRLPEAWIPPPQIRELRELVRHRARLVQLRSRAKADVHGVLAKRGIAVPVSDLFGPTGTRLLNQLLHDEPHDNLHEGRNGPRLPAAYAARIASSRRVMDHLDFEIDVFARLIHGRLAQDRGYQAVQTIPGIGRTFGAVFVAEIGDVSRFAGPAQLASWAGLTPKHHESDTHVHRGRITKQGSRLVRWAAVESVQKPAANTPVGQLKSRVADRRGRNIGKVAAARRQLEHVYYALRDGHVRALTPPAPQAA